jgi:CRP/FNR family transcriptional regulator, cyclic AMP receptor protein
MSVTAAMLQKSPLFTGFTETGLAIFAQIAERKTLAKGDVLCRGGDAGDALYVVLSGALEATDKGTSVVLGAGAHLGELSLAKATVRSVTVVAREPTEVALITRKAFITLAPNKPQACLKLALAIMATIEDRLRALRP